ncbi:TPA: alanine racemase [Klebsiella pneumoniae]|nr:alanine racemase [Klebsiella pneumoniae]
MENMNFILTSGLRGVPPGTEAVSATDIASRRWSPLSGEMSLPLLSLDVPTYGENVKAMMSVVKMHGAMIAPHCKTPMSPELAHRMIDAGAWGTSVADLRQAEVMLRSGLKRILLANQIGGQAAVSRLCRLLRKYPEAELYLFVDSPDFVDALHARYEEEPEFPMLGLLIEVGCGRGGVISEAEFSSVIDRIIQINDDRILLKGVAFYEGTCMQPDIQATENHLNELFTRVDRMLSVLQGVAGEENDLIISAGGSSLFDYVIEYITHVKKAYPQAQLLLRSGACFFSDNGNIRSRLKNIALRGKLGQESTQIIENAFSPTLRLWAEVISHSGESTAICGLGMRDSSIDQGLPVPLALWRDGKKVADISGTSQTVKLNDQHAFIEISKNEFRVGDVIEFGIRHPCTCLDKHDVIYGLNENNLVITAYKTFFG